MMRASAVMAAALAMGLSGQARADLTYNIMDYPADQNSATLSGYITTDGTTGYLAASDILSWSWTITPAGGTAFTLSSSDSGTSIFLENSVSLFATPGNLTIAEPPSGGNAFALEGPQSDLEYDRAPNDNAYFGSTPNGNVWSNFHPVMGGTDPWVIATSATAVPEPSSLTLVAIGAAGFAVAARRKAWAS